MEADADDDADADPNTDHADRAGIATVIKLTYRHDRHCKSEQNKKIHKKGAIGLVSPMVVVMDKEVKEIVDSFESAINVDAIEALSGEQLEQLLAILTKAGY